MSTSGTNFDGLDEATLLAFVEGGLAPAAEAGLRRSLAARPEVLASLEGMRRDRGGIARLPEVFPPAGLAEAALARAQREALHGLRVTEASEDEIPVSRVVPVRRAWWTPRRAALAAAAVLGVAGGLTLLAVWPGNPKIKPGEGAPVALGHDPVPTPTHVPVVDEVAIKDPPAEEASPAEAVAIAAPAEPVVVPLAVRRERVDEAARVLALARSGRLVLRVTARTPARCAQQLAAVEARSGSSQTWRARADAPAAVVAALSRPAPESPTPAADPGRAPEHIASLEGSPVPMIIKPREVPTIAPPPRVDDLVAMLRVAPTTDAINAARAVLSEQVGSVTFAELAEPLPAADERDEPATIESMLWWSGSPAQWARWANVPVIIER